MSVACFRQLVIDWAGEMKMFSGDPVPKVDWSQVCACSETIQMAGRNGIGSQ